MSGEASLHTPWLFLWDNHLNLEHWVFKVTNRILELSMDWLHYLQVFPYSYCMTFFFFMERYCNKQVPVELSSCWSLVTRILKFYISLWTLETRSFHNYLLGLVLLDFICSLWLGSPFFCRLPFLGMSLYLFVFAQWAFELSSKEEDVHFMFSKEEKNNQINLFENYFLVSCRIKYI